MLPRGCRGVICLLLADPKPALNPAPPEQDPPCAGILRKGDWDSSLSGRAPLSCARQNQALLEGQDLRSKLVPSLGLCTEGLPALESRGHGAVFPYRLCVLC